MLAALILFALAYAFLIIAVSRAFANSKCSCDTDEYGNDGGPNCQR